MNKWKKRVDKNLLKKFFRNQCTLEETEQVLSWFQTKEGEQFFKENLDRDMQQYADDDRLLLYPDVPSEKLLQRIRLSKKNVHPPSHKKKKVFWKIKTAVALLICSVLAGTAYFLAQSVQDAAQEEQQVEIRVISTENDQHRLVTLSDGTQIRLNSNSRIEMPRTFGENERTVSLTGEAWFDVAMEENRPFYIQAGQAAIQVLGTEFNVRLDAASQNVQVAVAKGKVSLNDNKEANGSAAILTENTYGVLNSDSREILIERTPVENYMSWISGRLYFYNEPLWIVSRYIERLYNVSFAFENERLRELPLSTNMAREDLPDVLNIIAQTLGIRYTLENNTVTWNDNINPKPSTQ